MKSPAKDKAAHGKKGSGKTHLRELKHDINNQLSNILLAVEQLRYEIPEASEDCSFYLDSISISSAKIGTLISEFDKEG